MSESGIYTLLDLAAGLTGSRAQQASIEAERQVFADDFIEAMKGLRAESRLDDLAVAMRGFKAAYGSGWAKRVKASGLPDLRAIEASILAVCNDGDGRWRGTYPLSPDAPRPRRGTWVVYQLLRGDELLYIGSTGSFAERAYAHSRAKEFDSWRAAKCASESHCRELEAALIDRYRPPLNRMIPTPRLVLA